MITLISDIKPDDANDQIELEFRPNAAVSYIGDRPLNPDIYFESLYQINSTVNKLDADIGLAHSLSVILVVSLLEIFKTESSHC